MTSRVIPTSKLPNSELFHDGLSTIHKYGAYKVANFCFSSHKIFKLPIIINLHPKDIIVELQFCVTNIRMHLDNLQYKQQNRANNCLNILEWINGNSPRYKNSRHNLRGYHFSWSQDNPLCSRRTFVSLHCLLRCLYLCLRVSFVMVRPNFPLNNPTISI